MLTCLWVPSFTIKSKTSIRRVSRNTALNVVYKLLTLSVSTTNLLRVLLTYPKNDD